MADTFFGASLTLATSGETFQIIEASKDGTTVEMIDTSHIGTSGGYKTKIPSDLKDGGAWEFKIIFDPDTDETNFVGVQQTCTVTFPVPSGLSSGATWAWSGTIQEHPIETLSMEEMMTASITVSVDGAITITAAS